MNCGQPPVVARRHDGEGESFWCFDCYRIYLGWNNPEKEDQRFSRYLADWPDVRDLWRVAQIEKELAEWRRRHIG